MPLFAFHDSLPRSSDPSRVSAQGLCHGSTLPANRIDWVDMNLASPQFREQVMQQTEVLYDAEQALAVCRELPRFLPLLQALTARLAAEGGE